MNLTICERTKQNKNIEHSDRKYVSFKYTYSDVNCKYCISEGNCDFVFCPAIMENLDDLLCDDEFIKALENADECGTALVTVKERYQNGRL